MDGIQIGIISENDIDKFSRGKTSRILMDNEAPSSPPLTLKNIKVVSGKRPGFQAKNDSDLDKKSEKKISARVPRFEDGALKTNTVTLEPVKIETKQPNITTPFGDGNYITIDVGQAVPKQTSAPMSSRRTTIEGGHIIKSRSRTRLEQMESLLSPPGSPPANRRDEDSRSPPVSTHKSKAKGRSNEHYRDRSEIPETSHHSSRRPTRSEAVSKTKVKARPKSPHRGHKDNAPGISIGGKYMTSGDFDSVSRDDLDSSNDTSHKDITDTKSALDKKLGETYPDGSFCAEDDDHLRDAIRTALEHNKTQTIQEALENGYEVNAEILKSLHRPDAITEVVEKLVSDRREKIRERTRLAKKTPAPKPTTKVSSIEKGNKILKKALKESKSKPAPVDDEDSGEESEEAIVIEESVEDAPKPAKVKVTVSDSSPVKTTLPGDSINVGGSPPDQEENVKLPKATRPATREELEARRGEFGPSDNFTYDPLGVGDEAGDADSVGKDNEYEESEEDDARLTIGEKKDDMLYRFRLIRQEYPGVALPRITKTMKLAKMVRLYEHVMSRIKLKVKTNNFKIFLIGGFLVLQFIGKKFKLDTAGLTVNQMNSMQMYEKYLRELGTSDWTSIGVDLPVTIRLPFFMLVNAGIFTVSKFIFKQTGKDVSVQFHKLYAQLTGGDDYTYFRDNGKSVGLDAEGEGGGGGEGGMGGLFGMLKSFLGMMGDGGGGENKPKRGESKGPTFKRKPRKPKPE